MYSPPTRKPRVLFTSVCRPFGGPDEGDSVGAELFHAQVTRAQGAFSHRQTIRVWAIDYLAENIQAPTVTLHYPSHRELIRELRHGDYTHVGINYVVSTFHKVREMVPLIRRYAPNAKIILGGYGTVLPDAVLQPWADAICREEGVGFMRRLLGEPDDAPIRHPHAPIPSVQVIGYQQQSLVGHVTAGLGCPNGCDFCCTSHFYRRKYVPLAKTGRDIYEAMMATRERARIDGQSVESFILIDEDFFLHHRRAREFLECVREGGEALSIMGFGSIRGISRFTVREIAEMGFDLIWNAFEGVEAGYGKQQGRPIGELYRDLKSVGIAQLTSMIIGFPYQDEAQIRAEFEQLMALEPTLTQCLIYFAFPGTPLHNEVIAEGRYHERFREAPDLRRSDGFTMHFDHPRFEGPEKVEALQREIYREDYARLGPSILRLGRIWLTGYRNLRNDSNPLLAARAERLRKCVRGMLPTLGPAILFAPSPELRARALALRRDIHRFTGAPTLLDRGKELGAPLLYMGSRLARIAGVFQQPGLLRTEHRTAGSAESLQSRHVKRLQGAPFTGVLSVLAEDLEQKFRNLLSSVRPNGAAVSIPGLDTVNTRAHVIPPSWAPGAGPNGAGAPTCAESAECPARPASGPVAQAVV